MEADYNLIMIPNSEPTLNYCGPHGIIIPTKFSTASTKQGPNQGLIFREQSGWVGQSKDKFTNNKIDFLPILYTWNLIFLCTIYSQNLKLKCIS